MGWGFGMGFQFFHSLETIWALINSNAREAPIRVFALGPRLSRVDLGDNEETNS